MMSPEPNQKMDELLKRHVAQRKAESRADFELHPATRNLLQGEVARTFAKTEAEQKKSLFLLWPRLAIVGAFTAMLVLTVLVLNTPKEKHITVAQGSSKTTVFSPAQSRIPAPVKSFSDSSADRSESAKLEKPAPSAALAKQSPAQRETNFGTGVAANEVRSETKSSEPVGRLNGADRVIDSFSTNHIPARKFPNDAFAKTDTESASVQTRTAAPSANSTALSGAPQRQLYYDLPAQNRLRFVQQDLRARYRRNFLSPAQPNVLQSFELARTGNQIRLTDSDGSVYEGEILDAAPDKSGEKDVPNKAEQTSGFAFRVAGTNQQINRIVQFAGEFTFTNAIPTLKEKAPAGTGGALQLSDFKKQSASEPSGLIQGKVSVGGTNEFEIRATTDLPR